MGTNANPLNYFLSKNIKCSIGNHLALGRSWAKMIY